MHLWNIALYSAQGAILTCFYYTYRELRKVRDNLRQSESMYVSVHRLPDDHDVFVACFLSPITETRFFFRHNEVQFFTVKNHENAKWFTGEKFEKFQNIKSSEVYVPGDDMLIAIRIADIIIHIDRRKYDDGDDIEYALLFKSCGNDRIVTIISVGHRMALMKIITQIAKSITKALADVSSGQITGDAGNAGGVGGAGGAGVHD